MAIDKTKILVGIGTISVDGGDVGPTEGGMAIEKQLDVYEKEVDQVLDAVELVPTKWGVEVSTNLAYATLENLKKVWNEAAAIVDVPATRTLPIGLRQVLPEHEIIFKGKSPEGLARTYTAFRAVFWKASAHSLQKGDKTIFPVSFRCLPDLAKPMEEQYGLIVDTKT